MQFHRRPPPNTGVRPTLIRNPKHLITLAAEIKSLLQKQAIEVVHGPDQLNVFFFQVLPDSKKGWRNPTNFRLEGPQCLSKASTFSHTTSSRCYTGSEQKQLVHYYRPEGCLLPHSNCDTSQEVPSFSCQRSDTNSEFFLSA